MGEFTIKKYIWLIIIVMLLSIFIVAINIYDDSGLEAPEFEPTEEEEVLMAEARQVIEAFNQVYIAEDQQAFEEIINQTTTNSDNVVANLQVAYDGAKEIGYSDVKVEFSEESIEEIAEDQSSFMYKGRANISLTKDNGDKDGYDNVAEYQFKQLEDGTYRIESIITTG
ncbi:hypothetical protein [Aquibacillus sediminis]|uniref:hypothetical protein n=1 Tax=Aquibacillus sediminis TaxID=2574734 RepID=UPI001107BB9D|nr:hypothetical protein [Aquibacillus sediminis]